jgi:hypothetical protein
MNAETTHVVQMLDVSMRKEVINVHALEEQKENHTHWVVPSQEIRLNVAPIQNALVSSHARMVNVITLVWHYLAENVLHVSQKITQLGVDVTVVSKEL